MAVSSPGRKVQLTRLTATWPPKRMVRSRVSRVKVIRASSKVCLWSIAGVAADSDVMRGLDPRIHPLPKNLLFGRRDGLPGHLVRRRASRFCPAMTVQTSKAQNDSWIWSTLVADRNIHVFDLELAHRLQYGPGQARIDLDLEVIHALERLMVLLPEHHLALGRIELHAFHGADQLL